MQFKDLTAFRIGGPIKYFFEVKSDKEIIEAGEFAKENNLKIFILGGGSDILVNDKGFDGIVVRYIGDGLQVTGDRVTAEAGVIWDELVKFSVEHNLQGLECMSGIPGTVGASPIQNIGAYGQEVNDTFLSLKAFEFKSGKFVSFSNKDCEFGYRESFFKKPENWQKYLITSVSFKLKKYKDTDLSLQNIRDEILRVRGEKLENPKKVGNAGSFFKNPILEKSKLSAGLLIDKAGWKGKSYKGAAVSSKNALILINKSGEASSSDVLDLSKKIIEDVKKKFGVTLEPEVQFIGFDREENISDYKKLQNLYPKFIYKSYKWTVENNDLLVEFVFSLSEKIILYPKLKFKNIPKEKIVLLKKEVIDNLVFNLGLAEIPSYWKATISPEILIEAGNLDSYQVNWWTDLLEKGMSQFFYENNIDFVSNKLFSIKSNSKAKFVKAVITNNDGVLIPVGGGKDSAVTLELLKDLSDNACFSVNPTKATSNVIKESKVKKLIAVERSIDPLLLKLNSKGFLNGHTPFSSLIAFLSVFSAVIYEYKDVVLSNERSSDEENTIYLGRKINHQHSKTIEFENKFREYNQKYLSNVNYFSFLRPLYEIQISKIFSQMDKYFFSIRSCNVGQSKNIWCCNCSKCLSTYILFYPFVEKERMKKIFPEDIFEKDSLYEILKSLILKDKVKPFECVGTRQELRLALAMSIIQLENDLPPLLKKIKLVLGNVTKIVEDDKYILKSWGENNLESKYEKYIRAV